MDCDGPNQQKHWQEIAAEASAEIDDAKLMELIAELCEAFDRSQRQRLPVTLPPTEERV